MKYKASFIFAILSMPISGQAALEFGSITQSIDFQPDQSACEVVYSFQNRGDKPVDLTKLIPSCGCMTPSDPVGTYAPGQTGEITVQFKAENRIGITIETIQVYTTDSPEPITLRLIANVPVLFRFDPENVIWGLNDPLVAKEVTFFDLLGKGVKPVTIYTPSMDIEAVLTKNAYGDAVVKITPKTTARSFGTHVYVDVDVGNGLIRKVSLLAIVQDPNVKDSSGRPLIRITD